MGKTLNLTLKTWLQIPQIINTYVSDSACVLVHGLYGARTGTVISNLPVLEGPLLQYGSPIRTCTTNPKPALLEFNYLIWKSHTYSSQSKAERGGTEFRHLAFWAN